MPQIHTSKSTSDMFSGHGDKAVDEALDMPHVTGLCFMSEICVGISHTTRVLLG